MDTPMQPTETPAATDMPPSESTTAGMPPSEPSAAAQPSQPMAGAAGKPTLYVCHGDERGAKIHPCARVQNALHAKGIEYDKVVAAQGNPIPFLRKGSREELREATGDTKLPALKLPDGTVLTHSRSIMGWIDSQ